MTEVEEELNAWLLNSDEPVAQQLALKASAALVETALEQAERDLAEQREKLAEHEADQAAMPALADGTAPASDDPLLGTSRLALFAIFLARPFDPKRRARLHSLLPQYLECRSRTGDAGLLLERWRSLGIKLHEIADDLDRSARIYRWRYQIMAAIGASASAAAALYFFV